MGEYEIKSFDEFHEAIQDLDHGQSRIYRGISDVNYPLIPTICRLNNNPEILEIIEQKLFNKFKENMELIIKLFFQI